MNESTFLKTLQEEAVVEHVVRHVQFTKWSEHEFPKSFNDVIDLLNTVEEAQQRAPNGVIIIHCRLVPNFSNLKKEYFSHPKTLVCAISCVVNLKIVLDIVYLYHR